MLFLGCFFSERNSLVLVCSLKGIETTQPLAADVARHARRRRWMRWGRAAAIQSLRNETRLAPFHFLGVLDVPLRVVGILARFSLEHIKVAKLGALRLHELHAPLALAMPKQPPRHSLEAVLVPWCVRFASLVFVGTSILVVIMLFVSLLLSLFVFD